MNNQKIKKKKRAQRKRQKCIKQIIQPLIQPLPETASPPPMITAPVQPAATSSQLNPITQVGGLISLPGDDMSELKVSPQQYDMELRTKLDKSNITNTDMSKVLSWNVWTTDKYESVNSLPLNTNQKKTFDGVVTLSSLVAPI